MVVGRLLSLVVLAAAAVAPHDLITTKLTWSQEISRIVDRHCASCHGKGAAVPLSSYNEARPWAKAIKVEVLSRRMPPWGAVKGFGEFRDDPSLSQDELNRIAEWVEGGAPEGDRRLLPASAPAAPAGHSLKGQWSERSVLRSRARLAAIRPLVSVEEAKVTAHLPDGSIVPLLWLREYHEQWRRAFLLREPVTLPGGTRIVSTPSFRLQVSLFPAQ